MKTAVSYARVPQQTLPDVEVGVRAEGSAGRCGEDVPLVLPVGTGSDPFPLLLFLVLAQKLDQRNGQSDRATPGARAW
ncbi:hypothetical protein GCM10010254_05860 [Streptomyces chromofuscus]|uniref:Uncharacterized protein n=1 Tax=Streptomyces chromofuscus TaxID=42881 RepID=A0A7M2T0Q7_STRCW|nr:hypothetical protein IPT68_17655 [Streptomyces chromofuscus]GGS88761.1 hypothetical protein GCM10010254_05860 [Streptomyces chromofuscus]